MMRPPSNFPGVPPKNPQFAYPPSKNIPFDGQAHNLFGIHSKVKLEQGFYDPLGLAK